MDVAEMLGDFSVQDEKPSCLMDNSMPHYEPVVKQVVEEVPHGAWIDK